MKGFEAQHWPSNPFDEPMVLLNNIVEVFRLNDVDDPPRSREFEDDI